MDEVGRVEAVETICPVATIHPLVEHTLQEHLLAGHQRAMWSTIRDATTLGADLVVLSQDLRM